MILSHKHKFIFIKTQKTAGTSIEIALSKFCGPDDTITGITDKDERYRKRLGYQGKQNHTMPWDNVALQDRLKAIFKGRPQLFYNHMSAREVIDQVGREVWDEYYKFCFERNPFDKFVSWYYWIGGDKRFKGFKKFIDNGHVDDLKGYDLYTLGGEIAVDDIYKYEEMPQALEQISQKLNLPEPLKLPSKKIKAGTRPAKASHRDLLSEEEINWIRKYFERELALFDYSF